MTGKILAGVSLSLLWYYALPWAFQAEIMDGNTDARRKHTELRDRR
ncbi:hypothetical protein H6A65_07725 [Mediterraneibacter glycyrrhizinilyticus]|nr:hypothetical protein [Mediterraneibacter glycyrrhizinilyticus]MBM6751382.1 hypothetical protein [Mediterraneibacter glycyrrhizinilyticus]